MLTGMFIVGILWVILGLTCNTNGDLASKLGLNVFPFLSGVFVAIYAAGQLGWVSVGV